MKSNAELIGMLKAHKKFEANMINLVANLEGKVHTRAAKLLLVEMRLDSQKHEAILDEALDAVEDKPQPQPLWAARIESYVDMQVMKQELEKHMQLEADMLRDAEKEIRETQDEALKTLLAHIAEDEKKHHKNIELIIRKSYSFSP
jgi:rubrerythrin